jgi:hypothetical protein
MNRNIALVMGLTNLACFGVLFKIVPPLPDQVGTVSGSASGICMIASCIQIHAKSLE